MSQIKDTDPLVALCASHVLGVPGGLRCVEIAALMGFSKDKTNRLLSFNRQQGVLMLLGPLWIDAKFYAAKRADMVARAKARKKSRETKRVLAKKIKARAVAPPPPPRKNRLHAPNSVWQLKDFL